MSLSIGQLLKRAKQTFEENGLAETAALDAEVLLEFVIGKSQVFLMTHSEVVLEDAAVGQFLVLIERRSEGMPVAYLVGEKEFWSLPLKITEDVLIPRPDTETLVERALLRCQGRGAGMKILDLGTGSGAIALALASELSEAEVLAVDRSLAAVDVARCNVKRLGINNIEVIQSDWFSGLKGMQFDLIVANPPYIDSVDMHLQGEVRFEPREALVAERAGFSDLDFIITGASEYLCSDGWLLVEHGFEQGEVVRQFFADANFVRVSSQKDLGENERVTEGCFLKK